MVIIKKFAYQPDIVKSPKSAIKSENDGLCFLDTNSITRRYITRYTRQVPAVFFILYFDQLIQ